LDDLVAAIGAGDPRRALELAVSPVLAARFARDRAVFSHVLALMIAAGHEALIEFAEQQLLADPPLASVPNRYGRTLLHDAAAWKNLRLVGLLLRLGADPNGGVHPPLYCVANEIPMPGGGDVVRALVRAGARVNEPSGPKRCTALHMAARRGNVEVAVALLDCSADINARDSAGVTPVQRAKNCRKPAVAALLASRGATRPNPLPSLGVS
jgi:ankyrin repeat protein